MRSAFIITHSVFYLTQVSFVVKAVSALTAAFRLVQLDHCSQSVLASCLRQVHPDLHEDILSNFSKLSLSPKILKTKYCVSPFNNCVYA